MTSPDGAARSPLTLPGWTWIAIGASIAAALAGVVGALAGYRSQAESACGWTLLAQPHVDALDQMPALVREAPSLALLIGLASVTLGVIGVIALFRGRADLLAVGVLVFIALNVGGNVGRSQGWTRCPGVPEPTSQDANLVVRFADPYEAARPVGPSACGHPDRGGPVTWVGTVTTPHVEWAFGDGSARVVDVEISTVGSLGLSRSRYLQITLSDLDAHRSAVYSDGSGGAVERQIAADGGSGTLRFSDLPYVPDPGFDPRLWPQTISGTVGWRCSGPER